MKNFREFFHKKLKEESFKTLYDQECHVCSKTMEIFSRLLEKDICLEEFAKNLDADPAALHDLRDAEFCSPELVFRLCRLLKIQEPENCPRRPRYYTDARQ